MEQASCWNEVSEEWESEADWVIDEFESINYYCFPVLINSLHYLSPMARVRWWLAVIDLDPKLAKQMGIDALVIEILNSLKGSGPAYSIDRFFLDPDILDTLMESFPYKVSKHQRAEEEWKATHLNFCLTHKLEWPRDFCFC